jgi:hypothetical protein
MKQNLFDTNNIPVVSKVTGNAAVKAMVVNALAVAGVRRVLKTRVLLMFA